MKVLLMSDIHSNWPALKTLISVAGKVDFIIHAGDSVGYYSFPNECVDWLKNNCNVNVMGNHDYAVINNDYSGFSIDSQRILHWTEGELSINNLKYLSNLPQKWVGVVDNLSVGVIHGGLTNPLNEVINPVAPEELLNNYLKTLGVKLIVVGHSHQLFVRKVSNGLIINPGSAGQPRDYNTNPSFVIININNGVITSIAPKRFNYDIKLVEKGVINNSLPTTFLQVLKRGY